MTTIVSSLFPVRVWHWADSGVCSDAGDRTAGEHLLGRLRVAHDLYVAAVPEGTSGVAEYLESHHVSNSERYKC